MREEFPLLLDLLTKYPGLRISGVATHLARADEPEHPEWTQRQLDHFHECSQRSRPLAYRAPIRHAAHKVLPRSYGRKPTSIWSASASRCMVSGQGQAVERASAGKVELNPVMTWKTRVAIVKEIQRG